MLVSFLMPRGLGPWQEESAEAELNVMPLDQPPEVAAESCARSVSHGKLVISYYWHYCIPENGSYAHK